MAVTCRVERPARAAWLRFIIVRSSRLFWSEKLRQPAVLGCQGMLMQALVPGNGIGHRWPRRLGGLLGGGSGGICVQTDNYWSGSEYAPNPNNAWNFNADNGNQNNANKNNPLFAVAVRSGG